MISGWTTRSSYKRKIRIIQAFTKSRKVSCRTRTFDAVLCVNEIFAVRGMRLAQRMGFRIPEDISFIGFTDGLLSRYASPSLTSVAQHGERMGAKAAEMLIDKVEREYDETHQTSYRTEVIPSSLIERESTALG